jgi:hypothetical protein
MVQSVSNVMFLQTQSYLDYLGLLYVLENKNAGIKAAMITGSTNVYVYDVCYVRIDNLYDFS